MNPFKPFFLYSVICWAVLVSVCHRAEADALLTDNPVEMPANYYAEPVGLPYDEEIIEQKQEAGWHWKEFRYTSLVFNGEAIRVHAVYAAPDTADKDHRAPGIVMTHGVFGAIKGPDGRYWAALSDLVKAGYAVLFFDWYPNYSKDWKPQNANEPKRFTTFGGLDYFGQESWYRYGQDWKESIHYQVVMAGRRAISWIIKQDEVDANKIGITGASYGGIFSSLIAAVDPRIKAVAPAVYTAGFGLREESYNMLPSGWNAEKAQSWINRFDSQKLLAKRTLPILYTVGANDSTFLLSKAMNVYAEMNEPKHLLIGANRGHDYWDFDQTTLFFDHALKNKIPRLSVSGVSLKQQGREAMATIQVKGEPAKVEFEIATPFEIDSDKGAAAVPTNVWKWTAIEARPNGNGSYTARWPLPVMRPIHTGDKYYDWDGQSRLIPTSPSKAPVFQGAESQGLVQVFARITDNSGAVETTPLAIPLRFSDEPVSATLSGGNSLPVLVAATTVGTPDVVPVDSNTPMGLTRVKLPADLPQNEAGKYGYLLWNWRKQLPDASLKTEEKATPTKQVFAPYEDVIPVKSFMAAPGFDANARGGLMNFQINGLTDTQLANRSWHGALGVGTGSSEEIPLSVTDGKEHLVTFVMGANPTGSCNARVWLRDTRGNAAIVRYRQGDKADSIFQFRFSGKVWLGVQITSQPALQFNTMVGPSAIFFD